MKILFVTSEVTPFSKSGGLADVAGSLPPALKAAGNEIAVISPLYKCVRDRFGDQIKPVMEKTSFLGWRTFNYGLSKMEYQGVTQWFVEYNDFFDRPKLYGYDDDKLRFAFFSRVVVDTLFDLDFVPGILHCNDWETALVCVYLKNDQAWQEKLRGIRTVYSIHNIAYQGQFGEHELYDTFGLVSGWYDGGLGYVYEGRRDLNLMKGAMLMADAVSTVSPTYAREIHSERFGHGLQGVADLVENKLRGILNGLDMDLYDPRKNPDIHANFSETDMSGKAICKKEIQKMFGLAQEAEVPLLCSVARLVEQKGIELVKQILPGLMKMGVQLIVFGQGDQKYVDYFNWAKQQWPGQLGFSSDYNDTVASQVFAGCDMYLMPSRFEPCGLSQMMAMRYGTVPIVHETGGLKDSVRPYSAFDGQGDGFSFSAYEPKALYLAVLAAVKLYFSDRAAFRTLRYRCMTKDFSWERSAQEYSQMYGEIYEEDAGEPLPFEEAFAILKDAYTTRDQQVEAMYAGMVTKEFHLIVQVNLVGRCTGSFCIEYDGGKFAVVAERRKDADATITASFDNLMGILNGTVNADKLFMNGQMKVDGNIAKSAELRSLLSTAKPDSTLILPE